MNRKFRALIILLMTGVMLLGSALPVAAQGPTPVVISEPTGSVSIFGEVVGTLLDRTGGGEITLNTKEGEIAVQFTADTVIMRGSIVDIVVGSRLAVTARQDGDELVALKVLVIPQKPSYQHVSGVVASAEREMVNVSTSKGYTFSLANTAAGNMTARPGQRVTVVMPADTRQMQSVAVRVRAAAASGNQSRVMTTTTARVGLINVSPALIKEVTVSAPVQISRRLLENMPDDNGGTVFDNMEPEMALRIWLSLPPELQQKIFYNLPDELKRELIGIIPELEKREAWLEENARRMQELWQKLEPRLALKIFQNTSPELLRVVWEYVPTKEVNQVWQRLTDREIRRVWPTVSTETVSANFTPRVQSVTVRNATPVKPTQRVRATGGGQGGNTTPANPPATPAMKRVRNTANATGITNK